MHGILTAIGWVLLAPIALTATVFLTEVLLGLLPARRMAAENGAPSFAIIMPAHDEAAGIAAIVGPLVASLPAAARLLVVADNCSDATAALARAAGAIVVTRDDPLRRGKGYALAHGRAALAGDPPDVVVVLDADCVLNGAGAARLAAAAAASVRPVQARYVFDGDLAAAPMVQISNFALLVKNMLRQRGLARLGAPALLGGTGMAFPWPVFAEAPLATADLVEDLALGLALAEQGTGARYLDQVVVTSRASSGTGTLVQRTRWEHGVLDAARRQSLPLLAKGLRGGRPDLVWTALHLMTPPLALLVIALAAAIAGEALLRLIGGSVAPLFLALPLFGGLCAVVMVAWVVHGRDTLAAATLVRLPLYILWKLPVYLGFARARETRWVRSERTDAPPPVH